MKLAWSVFSNAVAQFGSCPEAFLFVEWKGWVTALVVFLPNVLRETFVKVIVCCWINILLFIFDSIAMLLETWCVYQIRAFELDALQ